MKSAFVFILFCVFYEAVWCQIHIRGLVHDEQNLPLPNVRIELHELHTGTLTDLEGKFHLKVFKKGNYHLHVSNLGYQAKIIDLLLEQDTFLTVQLSSSDLELKEVVIESQIEKTLKQESSQDLSILNREYLYKRNVENLMRSIDAIPGVKSINIGVGTSKPVVRGLSFNRVVVAENGIKQEGQQWGGDHGLELDLFNVEEIEILKGPSALFYGSDAMGGVIHIRHKLPTQEGLQIHTLQGYRSNNQAFYQTTGINYKKQRIALQVRNTYQNYADYQVPADSFEYNHYVLPIQNKRLNNTAGREWNQMLKIGYRGNSLNSILTLTHFYQKLGFFSGAFGIPTTYSVQSDGNLRNIRLPFQSIHHFKAQWNYQMLIGKNWLEWDMAWQNNQRKEFSNAHSHGQNTSDSLALGLFLNTYSLNVRYFVKWKAWKWVSGTSSQLQTHQIAGFEYLIPRYFRFQIGVFQFLQYKQNERWTANLGARLDYGNDQLEEAFVKVYRNGVYLGNALRSPFIKRNYWNYSFASGLSWFMTEKWNLKIHLGTDFRYPAPSELASNGIHHGTFRHEQGNPQLLPEQGIQLDIGTYFENTRWEFKLSSFASYFHHYIFLSPTAKFSPLPEGGQIYQYLQSDAYLAGGELFFDYHFIKNLHASLSADFVWGHNRSSYRPLPFMPQPTLITQWEYSPKWLQRYSMNLWLEYRYVFPQRRVVINEPETPAFQLWNLGLQAQKTLQKHSFIFHFHIQNLWNARYFYHLSKYRYLNLYEPSRNFILQFQWKWN